jgi:PAS domain S-box-containing protein
MRSRRPIADLRPSTGGRPADFTLLDYRTLIEQLPLVTYTVTFEEPKRVLFVSPQVTTVLGYTPEEYRVNDGIWPDRIDARDRAYVQASLNRSRTTGEPLVCDYRFRHRDGRLLWIHDEATIVRDARDRPLSMQGIMQDVSTHRRIEQQLSEAQSVAGIGSWEWDVTTNEVTWSDELYTLHGVGRETFQPNLETVFALQHPEDVALLREIVHRALTHGTPYSVEHRIIRPDGVTRWWSSRAAVVTDDDGRIVKLVGTGQDVTARHNAERAVRDAEAKYRELVEHAVEGVFRTTVDGRFLMANQALARMLGYDTPEQLIAERTDLTRGHYVRPEERARFQRLLAAQGMVRGFEYECYRRDGTTIWLSDHARVVRAGDGSVCYEGTVEDITNRRRAEELLDLRARQQAAVARLGELGISTDKIDVLLDCATSLVADTLDIELVAVYERREDGTLLVRSGTGWKDGMVGSTIPGGAHSQAGRTLAAHRPRRDR